MDDKNKIDIRRMTHLRGPNIWTYRPVIEALVDIGPYEDKPSSAVAGFYERLTAWLPGLIEHRCGVGERGGFLLRLREGTWPGHVMEHVALELQTLAGMKTGFGKARSTSERGVYKVVIRTYHPDVGRAALTAARDMVLAAYEDLPFDVDAAVARLKAMVDSLCLGPSTASIVDAATERSIPHIRLTDGNLVQLGHGKAARRIWTAETDRTSAIAESISSDKDLTKELLQTCGVPIPEGRLVDSPEDAWTAAERIGVPVVVKPSDGNHGRGVALDIRTEAEVHAAYHAADKEGSGVIVERCIPGQEHRVLVVGGRVAAVARGEQAWVTGDGASTIDQLVQAQLNNDPRRGEEEHFPLDLIRFDERSTSLMELRRQGLTPQDVPQAGQRVLVQRTGNMTHDVTDEIHPEVAATAALAARVVGLDIAGIDLVCEDIGKPLATQGGAIVEVNAGPGLLMHLKPAVGTPRPVGQAIVDHLFAPGVRARIPVLGFCGGAAASGAARLAAWIVHLHGEHTGLVCADGLFLDERVVSRGDARRFDPAERLLINRAVDAAVFDNPAHMILAEGLPYDRCQVGVVSDRPALTELAGFDIRDEDQLFNVLRTQVDVVLDAGTAVLNADDARIADLARLSDGAVVLFSEQGHGEALQTHRDHGGRAVLVAGAQIVLAQGGQQTPVIEVGAAPLARLLGLPGMNMTAVLAGIAAVLAYGVSPSLIRAALKTYAQRAHT